MGGSSYTKNRIPSSRHVMECLTNTRRIIEYSQQHSWAEAPETPVKKLIFLEDIPKRKKKNYYDHIKHVPDHVWEEVQNNLHLINPEVARLILIMEASGFRVSDVCQLKKDCLVYKTNGWWLKGDQRKVGLEDHLVPISEEIVAIVKIQLENLETDKRENPNNFLFPATLKRNKGKAMSQKVVSNALNKLAEKIKILDSNGELYNFKNHAFRHRYGVNMINNGMKLLHVQKLMAHTSSAMTLTYARILDDTLRKEWEKANTAIRLNDSGMIIKAELSQQAEENGLEMSWVRHNLDSIRMDHGHCIKSPKLKCDFLEYTLEPPCIKNNCRSFHVDSTFLDYYTEQINKLESDISLYTEKGRLRSVKLVKPKLEKYRLIRETLINDDSILGLEKSKREYVGRERTNG